MLTNREMIQRMEELAKNGKLTPVEAIILGMRRSAAEMMKEGGAAKGGAEGQPAGQVAMGLRILISMHRGLVAQRSTMEEFLKEVREFYILARRNLPDDLRNAYSTFGLEWVPEEADTPAVIPPWDRMIYYSSGKVVPFDEIERTIAHDPTVETEKCATCGRTQKAHRDGNGETHPSNVGASQRSYDITSQTVTGRD